MKKLIIFGTGDYAEVAHYYFKNEGKYVIEYFTIDKKYYHDKNFLGLEVKIFEEIEKNISAYDDYYFFIAIGFSKQNQNRKNVYEKLKSLNVKFANFISKDALIANNVEIGKNVFILEQNNLQPFVKIGDNVVLWSGNHIGHHSTIGDHSFVTSHVVISGGVKVGDESFIGVNATIVDHINIENGKFIKANSLIIN